MGDERGTDLEVAVRDGDGTLASVFNRGNGGQEVNTPGACHKGIGDTGEL